MGRGMSSEPVKTLGQVAYEARFGTTPDRHPRWDDLHAEEQAIWNGVAGAICCAAAPVMMGMINALAAEIKAALTLAEMNATSGAFWAKRAENAERRLKENADG